MADYYYNPEKCLDSIIRFHKEFQPDTWSTPIPTAGKANEIAEAGMIDWPGRPGSIVNKMGTYQVKEQEYMKADEYDELLRDYNGFIFRKYIPRAYPGLAGLAGFMNFNPSFILGSIPFQQMYDPKVIEALKKFLAMAEADGKNNTIENQAFPPGKIPGMLFGMGFPPYTTGSVEVPFDILSDFFRGTAGTFDDLMDQPEKIAAACGLFTEVQIAAIQYLRAPLPVKRVFIPLHKGMDGFMSPKQYDELYWKPFEKLIAAIIGLGAVPNIYTEGRYNTRLDYLAERLSQPQFRGKTVIHFEQGDFKEIMKKFRGIACVSGGLAQQRLRDGTPEEITERMKWLIDNCLAGGGYMFDTDSTMEDAKYENVEAMFKTARSYG
jgi:hypothetical protein